MTQVHQKSYTHGYSVVHACERVFDIETKRLMPTADSRSTQSTETDAWEPKVEGVNNTPANKGD